mgnify:CR=1 FL=1
MDVAKDSISIHFPLQVHSRSDAIERSQFNRMFRLGPQKVALNL